MNATKRKTVRKKYKEELIMSIKETNRYREFMDRVFSNYHWLKETK